MCKLKFFLYLFLILSNVLLGQEYKPFENINFGVYGGINFYNANKLRGDFLVEIKTNVVNSTYLQISGGYSRSVQPYFYTISRYAANSLVTTPKFFASKYDITSKEYDIFPLSLGFQVMVFKSSVSPYISVNAVYNFLNSFIETSPPVVWSYNSIDEIPEEFKKDSKVIDLPANSYGITLGIGAVYNVSKAISLDCRYIYKYDNKIINTHHLLMGIYF